MHKFAAFQLTVRHTQSAPRKLTASRQSPTCRVDTSRSVVSCRAVHRTETLADRASRHCEQRVVTELNPVHTR